MPGVRTSGMGCYKPNFIRNLSVQYVFCLLTMKMNARYHFGLAHFVYDIACHVHVFPCSGLWAQSQSPHPQLAQLATQTGYRGASFLNGSFVGMCAFAAQWRTTSRHYTQSTDHPCVVGVGSTQRPDLYLTQEFPIAIAKVLLDLRGVQVFGLRKATIS